MFNIKVALIKSESNTPKKYFFGDIILFKVTGLKGKEKINKKNSN